MTKFRTIIVNWADMAQYPKEWLSHHKLRKAVFIDKAGWNIPVHNGLEFDQYDTAYSHYVVVIDENNECVGCARMMPTNVSIGLHSYMIKDAYEGKLEGIPTDILDTAPPCEIDAWEATRYAISPGVCSRESRDIMQHILIAMKEFAQQKSITKFIGLMPTALYRMFERAGYKIDIIGPIVDIDHHKSAVAYLMV